MKLKAFSLFVMMGLAVLGCTKSPSATVVLPDGVAIYEPQDIPLIEKGRLTRDERLRATTGLFQALKDNYVLWTFKKNTVGVNPEQVAQDCIAKESEIQKPSYRSDFLDRLTACVAQLKDSHLNLNAAIKRSTAVGLIGELAEVNGKIYIASVRKDLIAHAMQTFPTLQGLDQLLVPGTEIQYIDGRLGTLALSDFQKYIGGSTDLGARKEALFRFFQRNIAYPKSQYLKLGVVTSAGKKQALAIPWYYSSATDLESDVLLGERKLRDYGALGASAKSSGFWAGDAIYLPNELNQPVKFYVDQDRKEEFLTFGFLKSNPQKCYLKISTFYLANKKTFGDDGLPLHAPMVLEQLLNRCEAAQGELLLDLYYNEGGDLDMSQALLSALLPESVPAKMLRSFKIGKSIWEVANNYRLLSQENSSFQTQYETISKALMSDKPTTDWLVEDVGTEISGVFQGKLTVIVSPNCISACDAIVTGLKAAQRGTLIGEPANGTGAGFLSVQKSSITYADANNLFRLAIPNQLFSVVVKTTTESTLPFDENFIIEGKPATPDVPYSLTLKDITNNFADLKEKLGK